MKFATASRRQTIFFMNRRLHTSNKPVDATPLAESTSGSSTRSSEKQLLYMDTANYSRNFFTLPGRWDLDDAQRNIQRFCVAASRSGWTVVAFLDQKITTPETRTKWRKRRESQVRNGSRTQPPGVLRLVGDMFAAEGITVRYSLEMDCDATIARHAQADGASILSQDQDFLRYKDSTYGLYRSYTISKTGKNLNLIRQDITLLQKSSWPELGPPPQTGNSNVFFDRPYERGSPSPLVELGNPHVHVRPLRAALYHHLNLQENRVPEIFPVRNSDGECTWDTEMVTPDPRLADLLVHPSRALDYFDSPRPPRVSGVNWFKHQFALRWVIAEICSEALQKSLLVTLKPLMANVNVPPVGLFLKERQLAQQRVLQRQEAQQRQQAQQCSN